jgi:hypothetical protein
MLSISHVVLSEALYEMRSMKPAFKHLGFSGLRFGRRKSEILRVAENDNHFEFTGRHSAPHDVNGKNAALMSCQ